LPKYVPDKLIVGEVAYQIVLQGFNASLLKEEKTRIFIPYVFRVGHYFIKDPKHATQDIVSHLENRFQTRWFRRHRRLSFKAC
jgi:hypothetical protein